MIHIDIETRSEADISLGAFRYATDPSTEVLCVVTKDDTRGITVWLVSNEGGRDDLEAYLELFDIVVAHNFSFEYNILKHCLGIDIPFEKARCTMAMAAYHNLPMGLGNCAKALGLEENKDDEGKRLMLKMCKPLPKAQQKKTGQKYFDNPEARARLIEYCIQDVLTEEAIYNALDPLPEQEQKLWELDMKINYINGISVDTEFCEKAVELTERTKSHYSSMCQEKYGFGPTQTARITEFCGTENVRAATVRDLLADPKTKPEVREVLEWRQIVGNNSTSKFKTALDMQVDGKVYGLLQYSGATQTHRWAGRVLQIQNFPRGNMDEYWVDDMMELFVRKVKDGTWRDIIGAGLASDPIDMLKSSLRGMFVGDFAVCDYAQIEARVLPWLAGQKDVLKQFEEGTDLYVYTASQIYKKPMEEITKQERFIGKIATLALGFQGGARAFLGMAQVYGVKDMTEGDADEIKDKWREANTKIKSLWYRAEGAARDAIKLGKTQCCGRVKFNKKGDFLTMELPSGNTLFYHKPELDDDEKITFLKDGVRTSTYGGKLVENMTQAVARDVIADAMLRLPPDSIRSTIHDEVICEGIAKEELESIMLQAPEWAEGLPIGVDAWVGNRYRK